MVKHKKSENSVQHGERNYSGEIQNYLFNQNTKIVLFFFFRQILGITNENDLNVDDPCSDEFYNYFRETARNNAQIYEEVFNTLPTNRIRLFTEVEGYTQRPKLKQTDPLAVCFHTKIK